MRQFVGAVFFVLIVIVSNPIWAEVSWTSYTGVNSLNCIHAVAVENNYIWCATEGGVVKWDANNGTYVKYTKDDGLADNYVYTIGIDENGMKWFGTQRGLSCFDGKTWKTYKKIERLDSSVNLYSSIISIAFAPKGVKWFGTYYNGLTRFDGTNWTTFKNQNFTNMLLDITDVHALAVDKNGDIWVGAYGLNSGILYGVLRYDGENWTPYSYTDGMAGFYAVSIAIDHDNVKWFAGREYNNKGQDNVSSFDGINWTTYRKSDGLADSMVYAIAVDRNNSKWFGTYKGVSKFDGATWKTFTTQDGLSSNYVLSTAADTGGRIWLGTGNGLSMFDGASWKVFRVQDGPSYDGIGCVAVDKKGVKWFATLDIDSRERGYGVIRFDGVSWKTFTTDDGLADNLVRAIEVDGDNNVWFATAYGVSRFDGKNWETFTESNGLISNNVYSIAFENNKIAWLGTDKGVTRFDGTSWTNFSPADGLNGSLVKTIAIDKEGVVWFATTIIKKGVIDFYYGSGINSFDGKVWKSYTTVSTKYGLLSDDVSSIAVDANNIKWFGAINVSDNAALSSFDGKTWNKYSSSNQVRVRSIAIDSGNIKWVGTGGGIAKYDGVTWTFWNQDSGLTNEIVNAIALDAQGVKWIGTERGISRFDDLEYTPEIHVLSPNGGEILKKYFTSDITWTSSGAKSLLLEYSTDNSVSWHLIASNVDASTGSYNWVVPSITSNQCLVRITDEIRPAGSDKSDWVFTIKEDAPHALMFDGIKNYAYIVNRAVLNPTLLTLECWVKFFNIDTSGTSIDQDTYEQNIICKGPIGNGGYTLFHRRSNDRHYIGTELGKGILMSPALPLVSDTWFHLAVTYDGNQITLYVNGVSVQTQAYSGYSANEINLTSVSCILGSNAHTNFSTFNGLIDELRLWSLARSEAQIKGTMNREVFTGEGLAGAWHFNEGEGSLSMNSVPGMYCSINQAASSLVWVDSDAPISGLRIIYPNGGEIFRAGSLMDLRWINDGRKNLSLTYSVDSGETFVIIAEKVDASSGSYSWTIPDIESSHCLVEIKDSESGDLIDRSDTFFSISRSSSVPEVHPLEFALFQNRPNPFNPSTTIEFTLPSPGKVTLVVYDILGHKVRELVSGNQTTGTHSVVWDGRDDSGRSVSSGVYLSRLQMGKNFAVGRMLLLK